MNIEQVKQLGFDFYINPIEREFSKFAIALKPVIYNWMSKFKFTNEDYELLYNGIILKIWQTQDTYDREQSNPLTWARLITNQYCINLYRTKLSNKKTFKSVEEMEDYQLDLALFEAEPVKSKINTQAVTQVVQSLPEFERELFDMVYYKGYTFDETAQILEIPLSMVKNRIYRALKKIKKNYQFDTFL